MRETIADAIMTRCNVSAGPKYAILSELTPLCMSGLVALFGRRGEEGVPRCSMHYYIASRSMGDLSVVHQDSVAPYR